MKKIKTQRVVLEITTEEGNADPVEWDWPSLLDVDPDDVKVLDHSGVERDAIDDGDDDEEHPPFRTYFASADDSGPDATWSVYVEDYTDSDCGTPVEGSCRKLSTHPTEAEADAEANRLYEKD